MVESSEGPYSAPALGPMTVQTHHSPQEKKGQVKRGSCIVTADLLVLWSRCHLRCALSQIPKG